jgi:hypothetical protein
MEDRLAAALADVDNDSIVLEPCGLRGFGDELHHPLRLLFRELGDLAERVDVPLRNDEQVRLRLGVDVPNRDKAICRVDVLPLPEEGAEEAVLRQRESPPR